MTLIAQIFLVFGVTIGVGFTAIVYSVETDKALRLIDASLAALSSQLVIPLGVSVLGGVISAALVLFFTNQRLRRKKSRMNLVTSVNLGRAVLAANQLEHKRAGLEDWMEKARGSELTLETAMNLIKIVVQLESRSVYAEIHHDIQAMFVQLFAFLDDSEHDVALMPPHNPEAGKDSDDMEVYIDGEPASEVLKRMFGEGK